MRELNNSEYTSDYIRNIKKQKKGIANNPKILEEYNKVIEDTKIAIENLTEYINNHELLNGLLLKIQQEDSSFLVGALGLTKRGNNSSYYRGYLALDAQNIIEFRAADHYETENTAKDKTNNKAQYLFQVVMMTKPPKKQADNAITRTDRTTVLHRITDRLVKPIWEDLIVPFNEEGIWEAVLLYLAPRLMGGNWHWVYCRIEPVTSKAVLVSSCKTIDDYALYLNSDFIPPKVYIESDSEATVQLSSWGWYGLDFWELRVIKDGKSIKITVGDE